jgi:ribosomal protein S1
MIKKRMTEEEEKSGKARLEVGQILKGIVENIKPYGLFIRLPQIGMEVRGLLPNEELIEPRGDVKKKFPKGKEIRVEIVSIDQEGKIRLSEKSMVEREDREDYEKFLKKEGKSGTLGTLGDVLKDIKL